MNLSQQRYIPWFNKKEKKISKFKYKVNRFNRLHNPEVDGQRIYGDKGESYSNERYFNQPTKTLAWNYDNQNNNPNFSTQLTGQTLNDLLIKPISNVGQDAWSNFNVNESLPIQKKQTTHIAYNPWEQLQTVNKTSPQYQQKSIIDSLAPVQIKQSVGQEFGINQQNDEKQCQSEKPMMNTLFFPSQENFLKLLETIKGCQKTFDVCIYHLTNMKMAFILLALHSKGIQIKIITEKTMMEKPGSRRFISTLLEKSSNQIQVRLNDPFSDNIGIMHCKFFVIDDLMVGMGSLNWTKQAMRNNIEQLILTNQKETVQQCQDQFQKFFMAGLHVTLNDGDLNYQAPDPLDQQQNLQVSNQKAQDFMALCRNQTRLNRKKNIEKRKNRKPIVVEDDEEDDDYVVEVQQSIQQTSKQESSYFIEMSQELDKNFEIEIDDTTNPEIIVVD